MTKSRFISENKKIKSAKEKVLSQVQAESMMDIYEHTFDDYLEMTVQFGYVTLFASAYPLAAVFAILNNLVEIRSDAFKLVKTSQKPNAHQAQNIGPWLQCLEAISILAIITNIFIIGFANSPAKGISATHIWVMVIVEHIVIGTRWLLSIMIPDIPAHIEEKIQKQKWFEKQMARKYALVESKKDL